MVVNLGPVFLILETLGIWEPLNKFGSPSSAFQALYSPHA